MTDLRRGRYEQLISAALEERLGRLDGRLVAERADLTADEAGDRLALYLGRLLKQAISALEPRQRVAVGIELAQRVIALLAARPGTGVDGTDRLAPHGDVLQAVLAMHPDGRPEPVSLPDTPLLDTTLLTNAPGEPNIGHQLRSEIPSADRIDVLMAFVRMTGIHSLLESLDRHCADGRSLRVLTTTYTGTTELAALEALQATGAEVRVSYDVTGTRLHAKAWMFHRGSGYSTAYIGSSNLTHSAQVTGLEWNVRVSGARNPDVIDKFAAVFESYWHSDDFRRFSADEFRELTRANEVHGPRVYLSPVEIRLEPFQSRLLEQIELARLQGRHRNLLVSATGTGKTVMAAIDYQRLRSRLPRARLLFVAHRREILEQSLATFRHALRDANFGELWVGGARPNRFEHVFASVQSLAATGLRSLEPDHFDVLIVDEFHHAAAPTYDTLLHHLRPRELLGLTATPERSDGLPVLDWFEGRIAAELRLWDAIEQQRLCPFAYYGISDGTDLRQVPWRRGLGYDPTALDRIVTGNHVLARRVIHQVLRHVPDAGSMRVLGFCVSVSHARFMAAQFHAAGLPAVAVSAESPPDARADALRQLADGQLRAIFSVDLFNEGVDLPSVDTLLLLRATDSPTVFIQQLGRGLRRAAGKSICTVLDFVAQHRKEFRFDRRLGALLGGSRKAIERQIKQDFPLLPSGCHMQLDAVAAEAVLRNLRESLPGNLAQRANELRGFAKQHERITLKGFLKETGLPLEDIYHGNHSWSDLLQAGGVATLPAGPVEITMRRALGRLLHINDPRRINLYRELARAPQPPALDSCDLRARRLFHMLAATLIESVADAGATLNDAAKLVWRHPQVLAELVELCDVLEERIDHVQESLATHPDVPLYIHARYTRREILAAFADGTTLALPQWREGVRWLPEARVDLFAFTLDKAGGRFSPTTRYRDYAVSPKLIHWESQSTTRADSETGRRYQRHVALGTTTLLFARLTQDDRAFWLIGPGDYESHEGERPMGIHWRLAHELPGDLYAQFAAAVA